MWNSPKLLIPWASPTHPWVCQQILGASAQLQIFVTLLPQSSKGLRYHAWKVQRNQEQLWILGAWARSKKHHFQGVLNSQPKESQPLQFRSWSNLKLGCLKVAIQHIKHFKRTLKRPPSRAKPPVPHDGVLEVGKVCLVEGLVILQTKEPFCTNSGSHALHPSSAC